MLAFIAKESPRWLLAVGRKEEATRVVEGIAKVNGKEVDKTKGNSWQPLFCFQQFFFRSTSVVSWSVCQKMTIRKRKAKRITTENLGPALPTC